MSTKRDAQGYSQQFSIAPTWRLHTCPSTVKWILNCAMIIQWNSTQPWQRMDHQYTQQHGWIRQYNVAQKKQDKKGTLRHSICMNFPNRKPTHGDQRQNDGVYHHPSGDVRKPAEGLKMSFILILVVCEWVHTYGKRHWTVETWAFYCIYIIPEQQQKTKKAPQLGLYMSFHKTHHLPTVYYLCCLSECSFLPQGTKWLTHSTEAQRGSGCCPRSNSWKVGGQG